ncbi:hypothetical protein PHMEG_00011682 [Phytophthora megakarya]|uniref:CCHC-type domain-containing protein n=1 Tax=Phytophthora megakarya TaxID=4795 RepID=A0A225WB47_9STRA|nr:hypothetical protein PHMEG_00011682 [Phytophthora megakarya]
MGEAMGHDHMLLLTERLRSFVSRNNSADREGLSARVKLVLLYMNKWLGEALATSKSTIQPGGVLQQRRRGHRLKVTGLGTTDRDQQRKRDIYGRREKSVPDDIRALIPTNRRGEEPCLRYLGGVMCSGGTRDRCRNPKRNHEWLSSDIPRRLRDGLKILTPVAEPRKSSAPAMAIQPRNSPAPAVAIQPRTPYAPETAIQPRKLPTPKLITSPRALNASRYTAMRRCPQACSCTAHDVISSARATRVAENAVLHATVVEKLRQLSLNKAMEWVGLQLPTSPYPVSRPSTSGTEFLLNTPLQRTLSEFVRRTQMSLPALVELVRRQTETDFRPNKRMVPEMIAQRRSRGVHKDVSPQSCPPDNHGSTTERVNILRKNVCKEQDAGRWLVLDLDIFSMWPEVFISSFGIVDKAGGDPLTTGRTIHDLSFPEGASINYFTDQDAIPKANYRHCDAVAAEIIWCNQEYPDAEIKIMAGDVTSAFRNVSIHSHSVHRFAGRIEIENTLVMNWHVRSDGRVLLENMKLSVECPNTAATHVVRTDCPHLADPEWEALRRLSTVIGEAVVATMLRTLSPTQQHGVNTVSPGVTPRKEYLKLHVSNYEGKEDEALLRWHVGLDTAIMARRIVDPLSKVAFAMSCLGGRARSWVYGRRLADPTCFRTYESFKKELKLAFEPSKNEHRARAEFVDLQQMYMRTPNVHGTWSQNVVTKPIDETTKAVTFLKGLKDGPVKTYLFREYPSTLEAAITLAMQEEFSLRQAKLYLNVPLPPEPAVEVADEVEGPEPMDLSGATAAGQQGTRANVRCFRCGNIGHYARKCTTPVHSIQGRHGDTGYSHGRTNNATDQ